MPVDSQVVNGRIVGVDGAMPSSLEIDDGRIVSVDTEPEVWRTVDASGYFVLPGAVQPGDPTVEHGLTLVQQGISTAIVRLQCGPEELAGEIERLAREAVLDYCVCWSLPGEVTESDLAAARDLGVHAFEASGVQPTADYARVLGGATLRLAATSGYVNAWMTASDDTRVILSVRSAQDLHDARAEKARGARAVYLEIGADLLDTGADEVHAAIDDGEIDIILGISDGPPLLQSAYRVLVEQWEMPALRLVELCATAPAAAHGIGSDKGKLEPGADADFVVFDPAQETEIDGVTVQGRVVYGQLRGDILIFNDELHVAPGNGRMVPRNRP